MRDLRAALLVCSLCCVALPACSKAGAPANEAPTASPSAATASEDAPAATTAPPAAPVEATPSPSSVIAAVLDSRPMTMYLHPEVEGRVPVRVAGPALAGVTVDAVAQGQPVKLLTVVEATTDPEGPCVIFERIDIGEATAEVELRYPIEGVLGHFVLEREGAGWRIVKAELAER
jgi:hypothetical protein